MSQRETLGKGHGRIGTRRAQWITDLSWMEVSLRVRWPKLAGVGLLEREREIRGKVSRERAFPL
ncbi:MAG: hypothetical protein LBI62_09105 [Candidatus Accumulibacter sp.]|jgi:hypothetical protein|nr:hypothetical protein [Accumulibacter sp.]